MKLEDVNMKRCEERCDVCCALRVVFVLRPVGHVLFVVCQWCIVCESAVKVIQLHQTLGTHRM